MSLESARRAALDQLRAGRDYAGVDVAWKYLAQVRDDREVGDELAGALRRLGFEALAAYVADGFRGDGGAVAWGKLTSRWSGNLKALQSRQPELAAQLRGLWNSRRDSFALHQSANGDYQIRLIDPEGPGLWLPCFGDHRRAAEEFQPPGGNFATGGCVMIYGVGAGWLVNRVYQATEKVFLDFSCCLHVLAPSAAELAAAMHLHDWRRLLSDRRVLLFVGPDCHEQQERFLRENPLYPIPAWRMTQVSWDNSRAAELEQSLARITEHRDRQARRTSRELGALYEGRDLDYWAARYARRDVEPLRVLGVVSRHSTFIRGSMEHCLSALETLGHHTRMVTEAEPFFLGHSARELHETQIDFGPDLILMIDNYRGQMPDLLTPNVPCLMWIQDVLGRLLCPEAGRAMGPLDFVMGYGKDKCLKHCEYPPEGFLACDVPTGFVGDIEIKPEYRERHACDVSFVSTASKPLEQIHRERRAESPPELIPLVDAIYEEVRARLRNRWHVSDPGALLERMMDETGVEVTDATTRQDLETWYTYRLFDWGFRQEGLLWAADWARRTGRKFHIYGRGWESFPGLEEFARGHIWEREELAAVHRLSKINLQLFAYTALHQRTYDILGAGGFVLLRRVPGDYRDEELARVAEFLTDHRPQDLLLEENRDIAKLLQNQCGSVEKVVERLEKGGKLLQPRPEPDVVTRYPVLREVTFDSPEQLAELLDSYLGNEEVARSKARELRESILAKSTYRARMASALDFISRRLRLRARYGWRGAERGRRGPEAPSAAKLLLLRNDFSSAPSSYLGSLERTQEAWLRGIAAEVSRCEMVTVPSRRRAGWEERTCRLLEEHEPDAVVTVNQPLSESGNGVPVRQLLLSLRLSQPMFDMGSGSGVRMAAPVNAFFPEICNLRACRSWTGLPVERIRGTWMPCPAEPRPSHRRAESEAQYDLSVAIHLPAPAEEIIRSIRKACGKEAATQAFEPDRLLEKRQEILDDDRSVTTDRLDALYEEWTGGWVEELSPRVRRLLRYWFLPLAVESWHQERWLERLARWAEGKSLRLRVFAPDAWKTHASFGGLVASFEELQPAPLARLHVGFNSSPIPPASEVAAIAAGVPTLLWRPPNQPSAGQGSGSSPPEALCPALEELAPGADGLRFASWEELVERVEAHLADSATLRESTRGVGESLRANLSPRRIIKPVLEWLLAD
jgi:hypothetical protein